MNTYTQRFQATCPVNGIMVAYVLTIATPRTIMVEAIQAAVGTLTTGYHEAFADKLWQQFGGTQTLTANHHGTDIETVRGASSLATALGRIMAMVGDSAVDNEVYRIAQEALVKAAA
jgi:hypothetical protein